MLCLLENLAIGLLQFLVLLGDECFEEWFVFHWVLFWQVPKHFCCDVIDAICLFHWTVCASFNVLWILRLTHPDLVVKLFLQNASHSFKSLSSDSVKWIEIFFPLEISCIILVLWVSEDGIRLRVDHLWGCRVRSATQASATFARNPPSVPLNIHMNNSRIVMT